MKLATLQDGSRDGQLVLVSRDLGMAHYATGIASRLQQVLDDWGFYAPQLQDLYDSLNAGRARHAFPFDTQQCMAPLPRAYQCLQGNAYLHATELEYQARNMDLPASLRREPLLQQAASDASLGPCNDIVVPSAAMGIDFGAGLAVVTGDVERGCTPAQALDGLDTDTHLHVSFDVDFLDPDIAPGVGTTVPGGPTYREAQLCMEMIADSGCLASLDIVELNPALDVRNKTALLAVDLVESLFGKSTLMRVPAKINV